MPGNGLGIGSLHRVGKGKSGLDSAQALKAYPENGDNGSFVVCSEARNPPWRMECRSWQSYGTPFHFVPYYERFPGYALGSGLDIVPILARVAVSRNFRCCAVSRMSCVLGRILGESRPTVGRKASRPAAIFRAFHHF
jgi:hypothetical protein